MRRFAEIAAPGSEGFGPINEVRCVFDWELDSEPEYAPDTVYVVDVTGLAPEPIPGCTYGDGGFTFPPPPPPPEEKPAP